MTGKPENPSFGIIDPSAYMAKLDEMVTRSAQLALSDADPEVIKIQLNKAYQEMLKEERKVKCELAEKKGYETLTTDTKGRRTAQWFLETGKAFSTGEAKTCIAIGICHEDIGIAGVHVNTRPIDVILKTLLKMKIDPNFLHSMRHKGRSDRAKETVSPVKVSSIVTNAVYDAMNQFAMITGRQMPQSGITIVAYGMDYLSSQEAQAFNQVVIAGIAKHPLMRGSGFFRPNLVLQLGHQREIKISLWFEPRLFEINFGTKL